ncbi:MAG TPA: DUF2442 domain-containing protein [Caldilineaceae bacterium]|nr:DUF2442 domain-containing protein [Caldilineaceae bacterium]
MNPRVVAVKPNSNHTITLTFTNGEVRVFDVKPYLDRGIFQELSDLRYFNSVKPVLGSVQWKNGQDSCPDTLYMDSFPLPDGVSDTLDSKQQAMNLEVAT